MAKCLFAAVPDEVSETAVVGLSATKEVQMLAAEGITTGSFTIQNLEKWINLTLGENKAKVGIQQNLTIKLSAKDLIPGIYRTTLKIGWPTSDGQSCLKNLPVTFRVTTAPIIVAVPLVDPRGSAIIEYTLGLIIAGWTKGAPARDSLGNPLTNPKSSDAREWCLTGALEVARDHHSAGGTKLISQGEFIIPVIKMAAGGVSDLAEWNDAPLTTKEKVIDLLKNARNLLSGIIERDDILRKGIVKSVNDTLPKLDYPKKT